MPTVCCVVNCSSRSNREKLLFYTIPKPLAFKHKVELNELSALRRERWLNAIKRTDFTENKIKNARVCSKHFITGRPAKLDDKLSPDWVPSVKMGYEDTAESSSSRKVKRGVKRKKVKEVTPLLEHRLAEHEDQQLPSIGNSDEGEENKECRKTGEAIISPFQQIVVEVKEEPAEEPDESFWKNPHFNSLQGYIEEKNCLTRVCRICFEAIMDGASYMLTSEHINFQTDMQKKVQFILPNINLDLFSNSMICHKCIELIDYSIELQEKWVRSQEQLEKIIDKKRADKAKGNDVLIMVKIPTEEQILKPVQEQDLQVEHLIIQVEDDSAQAECEIVQTEQTKPFPLHLQNKKQFEVVRTKKHSEIIGSSTKSKKQKIAKKKTNTRHIPCSVCKEVLPTIVKYVKHTSQHVELRNRCFRCKDKFPNTKRLLQHLTKCLEKNEREICKKVLQELCTKYVCPICKQEFLFSWYLEQHLKICKKLDSI